MTTPRNDSVFTLAQLLENNARVRPDELYAIFPDVTITYGALYERSRALAKGLIALGLEPGQHVGIMMPNCLDFLLAHFAVQLAGGKSVLYNARFKQHELATVVPHTDARIVITTDRIRDHVDFAGLLAATFPRLSDAPSPDGIALAEAPLLDHIVLFGETRWEPALSDADLLARGASVPDSVLDSAHAAQHPEHTAVMIYTSGTTAAPKACKLSHASLQRAWRVYSRSVGLAPGETVWDPMPFFHSGGIGLITGIMACGAAILSTPHFDPDLVAQLIEEYRVEHLYPGFHTLSLPVLRSPHYDRARWTGFVKSMVNVGPLGTQYVIRDLLPPDVPIMNLFGMSESSGLFMLTPPDAPEDKRLASSGRPLHGAEAKIVDPETLEELPADTRGEIVFRGAGAFRGYYKDPAHTHKTILADGWVRTGDLGMFDAEGWLYFLGRLKDMLKVGGENVAAAEVESFLSGHPAVKFVQVLGRSDERLGEVPVAFVECNPGMSVDEEGLLAFCKGQIANFKIPRQVIFVTEWPMSATKVQKFRLRELL
ncbi:class I adenylate-forming enzyme family protein [Chelatococcus asaccharovorans]|uniref:Fatty-acyl-CoA synthase n=1 Tax=Chelatococcus asaccharovorans TaxID=28210 RepID=A0A2V3UIE2_9HYPH|nr:class I adenylate-forming enzyme family protein [Chelatococcus asaccharovorans]MBS7706222.1 acyl--CoA ligase [Chelatococcus asaccharovorans]PXW65145.1 fatty-acyl-CoA synthase [Chelatococcus asaccharovorans]